MMRSVCLCLLCLGLWQCKKQGGNEIVPEPVDKNGDTLVAAPPFIISASGALGLDVAMDTAGNIYVTGSFGGTTSFDSIPQTSVGIIDAYVAKYSAAGEIQWVRSIGGPRHDEGRSIAVDESGNVYVAGDFYETASTGGKSATSEGDADIFIAKYNTNGEAQWIQSAGSDGGERGHDLTVDSQGSVFVTGEFQGAGKFGNVVKQSAGEFDTFVAKYDTDGVFQWVQTSGGAGRETGFGVAADPRTGDVYVSGVYFGTTTFGNVSMTSAGDGDIFLAKYNKDGAFQWMLSDGSTSSDAGRDLVIDPHGNVFMTGQGSTGGFVNKYDSNGNIQWGQTLSFGSTGGSGVATDQSGNAYVVNMSGAILKYNPEGMLQRAQVPYSSDELTGEGITTSSSGKLFMAGYYSGTIKFGETSRTSTGFRDMFAVGGDL